MASAVQEQPYTAPFSAFASTNADTPARWARTKILPSPTSPVRAVLQNRFDGGIDLIILDDHGEHDLRQHVSR